MTAPVLLVPVGPDGRAVLEADLIGWWHRLRRVCSIHETESVVVAAHGRQPIRAKTSSVIVRRESHAARRRTDQSCRWNDCWRVALMYEHGEVGHLRGQLLCRWRRDCRWSIAQGRSPQAPKIPPGRSAVPAGISRDRNSARSGPAPRACPGQVRKDGNILLVPIGNTIRRRLSSS